MMDRLTVRSLVMDSLVMDRLVVRTVVMTVLFMDGFMLLLEGLKFVRSTHMLVRTALLLEFSIMVRVAIGVVERVVDGVLVEMNRLDIVLVVILMMEGVVILVISVPLGFMVRVLVMVGLVVRALMMSRVAVLSLVFIGVMGLHVGPVVISSHFMMTAMIKLVGSHLLM